jgi:hypothetical protein
MHGGARPGTGPKPEPRKRGRPFKQPTRDDRNQTFDAQASDSLPELFETIKAIATGYKIAAYSPRRNDKGEKMEREDGTAIYVYEVPPDKQAAFYLVDRAAGKAVGKSPEAVDTELTLEVIMPGEESDDDA